MLWNPKIRKIDPVPEVGCWTCRCYLFTVLNSGLLPSHGLVPRQELQYFEKQSFSGSSRNGSRITVLRYNLEVRR